MRKYPRRVYRAFRCRDCKGVVSAEDHRAGRYRRFPNRSGEWTIKRCLCCAARCDRRAMREASPHSRLRMSVEIDDNPKMLSNRCKIEYGMLNFSGFQRSSGHNWYRCKTVHVWFTGPDGYEWYGRGVCRYDERWCGVTARRTKNFIGVQNIVDLLWDQMGGAACAG